MNGNEKKRAWQGVCASILLIVAAFLIQGRWESGVVEEEPIIIAHRAGAANGPENTLAALERAISAGANTAEMDIRMTRDGVLIAIHDDNLSRTTGLDQVVDETNYGLIRQLDAGYWYSDTFEGESIPTLEQILDRAKGKIQLILEIKCVEDAQAVEELVEQIQADGMEEQCAVACTELDVLRQSKNLAAEMDTIYVGYGLLWNLELLDYVDGYSIRWDGLDKGVVERVHANGKKIYAWTVNTEEDIDWVLELGVDGVVTDDPELAVERSWEAEE